MPARWMRLADVVSAAAKVTCLLCREHPKIGSGRRALAYIGSRSSTLDSASTRAYNPTVPSNAFQDFQGNLAIVDEILSAHRAAVGRGKATSVPW